MHTAEQGGEQFEKYTTAMDCVHCIQKQLEFPCWFKKAVRFYASLKQQPTTWRWGPREPQNLELTADFCTVTKKRDSPDYSCVLGCSTFQEGIHAWNVLVENVSSMWVGISRGVEEKGYLGSCPVGQGGQDDPDFFLLAFHNRGITKTSGNFDIKQTILLNYSYCSGQKLSFELDMLRHTLKMAIDGTLAVVVYDVDDRGVRPFICMDYYESVKLLAASSVTISTENDKSPWKWDVPLRGDLSTLSLELSRKKEGESGSRPLPACALGSIKFNSGIHKWEIAARNVRDMWIGVARGEEDRLWQIVPSDCCPEDSILAYHSSGEIYDSFNCRTKSFPNDCTGQGFVSGQRIEAELDMFQRCLRIRVEGVLVMFASDLDGRDLRPYVCFLSSESVKLLSMSSKELVSPQKSASWKWGGGDVHLKTGDSGEDTIIRTKREGFSSIVGSQEFEEGIHRWQLRLHDVTDIWVGIARNIEENDLWTVCTTALDGEILLS